MSEFYPMVANCLLGVPTADSKYTSMKGYAPLPRWRYNYERDMLVRKNSERPLMVATDSSGAYLRSVVLGEKTPDKVIVYRDAAMFILGKDKLKELVRFMKSIFKVVEVRDRSKLTIVYTEPDCQNGYIEIYDIM